MDQKRLQTKQTDWSDRRNAVANPRASSSEILQEINKSNIYSSTIRHRLLYKYNIRSYRPRKVCLLSVKNIRDRVSFCKRHRDWTTDDLAKVQFSDESMISQFQSFQQFERRPKNMRLTHHYDLPEVKRQIKVMIVCNIISRSMWIKYHWGERDSQLW